MRSLLIFLLFWGILTNPLPAQEERNPDELLAKRIINKLTIGKFDAALEISTVAIEKYPESGHLMHAHGMVQATAGDAEAAYGYFSKAITLDSMNLEFWQSRALMIQFLGYPRQAIKDYEQALDLSRTKADSMMVLNNLATAYGAFRDFETQHDLLFQLHQRDSTDLNVMINLAMVYGELDRRADQLDFLERVHQADPKSIPAIINLGFYHQEMENHEQAIEYFNRAEAISSHEALIFSNRSMSHLALGNVDAAIADIDRSVEIFPDNSWAYKIRGLIYLELGDRQKACQEFEIAIELGYTQEYGEEVNELKRKHCLTQRH